MTIAYYTTTQERLDAIDAALLNGEALLHDDFVDDQGQPTDGTSGRLTFGVKQATPAPITYVTQRQFRIAVERQGLGVAALQAAFNALPDGPEKTEALIEWQYNPLVYRDNPVLIQIITNLGYTEQQLTNLFKIARKIR